MSEVENHQKTSPLKKMSFATRVLEEKDIPQLAEIERDAFPTLFPPTSFRREIGNRLAKYIVAWRCSDSIQTHPDLSSERINVEYRQSPLISRFLNNARNRLSKPKSSWEPGRQFLAGFLGTWYMVDEAHIVSIGVRTNFRGYGIGELLLIAGIEQALVGGAKEVTLEVRVSNYVAINLYQKYGFKKQGVRKAYYTDNREDALILTTDLINVAPYPETFRALTQEHEARWGRSERVFH